VRIVFLNPSGALGGAETALIQMLAALREARPSWTLTVIASAAGPLIEQTSRLGVSSLCLAFPPSVARLGEWGRRGSTAARAQLAFGLARAAVPALTYGATLRRRLAALDPDVVHTNGLKMHLLGSRCAPSRAKVLWHLHDYPDARPVTSALLRACATKDTCIVANSDSVAERARALFGRKASVSTIYNAVDLERFHPEGKHLDLDARCGLPPLAEGGLRIGLVATFARWKGHDVFLKALAQMRSDVPVRGYVIGAPIYETESSQFSVEELRALASASGAGQSVGFTGHVEDVPSALRALDIVVHASVEPEPFGLVIAEAMACGRPLVVSRAGGAAEIAVEGALFHAPGDAVELASRLSQLADDPGLRARLAGAGRDAATRLFSRSRLASALIPVYESL
jgi:glycosyltransferase involved in cell wall biosynthesis